MIALNRLCKLAGPLPIAAMILMIPIYETRAAERRVCLIDLQIFGAGGGLLCNQSAASETIVDTSCTAFRPIRYSRKDTPETQKQIRGHNAAFDSLCK